MRSQKESRWEFLIRRSKEKFEQMTPEEKEEIYKRQRESWVRGELELAKDPRTR